MKGVARSTAGRNQSNPSHPSGQVVNQGNADNFTTAQKNINSAIQEYCLKYGFMKTIDSFQDELNGAKTNVQKNLILDENTGLNYMINVCFTSLQLNQAFNLGKREHFFISWNRFVPLSIRQSDVICQKLEFYIHIYFAIFPVHPNNSAAQSDKELKKELLAFKQFLDTKGAELSKTSEFLQYYALPYVQNPLEHPIFKGLCSKKWANDLRQKLKGFLEESLPKISSPQLFHWYANFKKKLGIGNKPMDTSINAPEVEDLKERLLMLQKHYLVLQKKEEYTKQTLIESQSKWTNFSKEILNISKELLFSLEQMGAKMTINKISLMPVRDKMARYEAFLNNNSEELQTKHGINMTKKSFLQNIHSQQQQQQQQHVHQQQMMGQQQQQQYGYQQSPIGLQLMDNSFEEEVEPIQRQLQNRFEHQQQLQQQQMMQQENNIQDLAPLNFAKIKHFLMNSNEELKICATLQALRWRLTKAKRKTLVKQVIYSYMSYDLLGCMNPDSQFDQSHRILDKLLQGSKRILEYTMTFINALASECLGRTYLLQKTDLVEVLVRILNSEQADTSLRQNALGTLQKFSLRRKPQTIMIQLDMIQWIANVLRDEGESLSDYSIEYATALLMNLSLRAAGKDKCEDPEIELLKVLNDLVEHENLQVRTYVNGTLYSIFTRKKLREEAKELGMPEVLQYLMQQSDDQFKRQIQYILDQLNTQAQNEEVNGNTETGSINPNEADEEDFDDEDEDEEEEDEDEDMVEEEEGEFNDIIDEQGILVGEDLLASEFISSQEEAVQQMRQVQIMMERDRQKRMQQMQQQNSVSISNSPYSQPRDAGRPLMRPITPIKSAQATRIQNSTNTSQLTNMNQYQDQPLHNQHSQPEFDETDAQQPPELQSKPKIPRTPATNQPRASLKRQQQDIPQASAQHQQQNQSLHSESSQILPQSQRKQRSRGQQQNEQQHNESYQEVNESQEMNEETKLPAVTKNGKAIKDDDVKEFDTAFRTREKISRSPPESKIRFGNKQNQQKKRIQPTNGQGGGGGHHINRQQNQFQ